MLVDAETLVKKPAFDHEKLAASLSTANNGKYSARTLPFSTFRFVDSERSIEFTLGGSTWRCDLRGLRVQGGSHSRAGPGQPAARPPEDTADENPREYTNDVYDGMVDLTPQAQAAPQGLQVPGQDAPRGNQNPKASPGRETGSRGPQLQRFHPPEGQHDGRRGDAAELRRLGRKLLHARPRSPGLRTPNGWWLTACDPATAANSITSSPRHRIRSSPKHWVRDYAKPGDALDVAQPVLMEIGKTQHTAVDNALFPNPYSLSNPGLAKRWQSVHFRIQPARTSGLPGDRSGRHKRKGARGHQRGEHRPSSPIAR